MWLLIAGSVGVLSWWLTGLLAAKAAALGPVDHPNDRSLHHLPTPKMGGIAMVVSGMVGVILSAFAASAWAPHVLWILGGMLFLAVVSFWDDRKGIPVWLRLSCHLMAATAVASAGDVRLSLIHVPALIDIQLGWLAGPVTVVFLVWMTNLYNFMDGMDGFAGGMTVLGFGMLACFFWIAHQPVLFFVAFIQAAAAMGFLLHNFPPAKIFMGDVGSISTGFLAGSLAVLGCREQVFDLWVPLVIFSPFILDATATLIRRAMHRERIWRAHREHYYQRLVLAGWSHRRTVTMEYGVMACCGLLALSYHMASDGQRILILAVWMTLFLVLAGLVRRVQVNGGR
jgi:UDP-N-acetylmuramyl pentapeptide phosphotransferase/UDP-N-acetylglucosamine-1-phosphate transferase